MPILQVRLIYHFLLSVLVTFTLAAFSHSQFVLAELSSLGVTITWQERLSMTANDWFGLLPTYSLAITFSLFLAYLSVGLFKKFLPGTPTWLYPIAGAVALLTMLAAMQPIMDITLLAGARSFFGLASQCLAGAFGGWVFMRLRDSKTLA